MDIATTDTNALAASVADPAEVDISEHHYTPRTTHRTEKVSANDGFQIADGNGTGFGTEQQSDPMMAMMQQMLGGGGIGGGMPGMDGASGGEIPPMLAAMMNGGQSGQATSSTSTSAQVWKIVHTLSALCLALYTAISTRFDGSKLNRLTPHETDTMSGPRLFYMFATLELVLQTSRFLVEKGRLGGSGWLAMIANSGMVPEPYAGYVRLVGRYSVIFRTVVADALTVVFVLGVVAWWRGSVA